MYILFVVFRVYIILQQAVQVGSFFINLGYNIQQIICNSFYYLFCKRTT